jgi:hypothetical protein
MTIEVDEAIVRDFLKIVSDHVVELAKGAARPGVLQICCLSPVDEKLIPHRFRLSDVEGKVKTAVEAAKAGLNVYLEARTVRADLRGAKRGGLDDTEFVFGLVVDSDNDKGKGGTITARPSFVIETSSGNYHYWYFFAQRAAARRAQQIGDAMRASTGADQDTGVVTQCYRIPGTPNYPSRAKQARGRTAVEPTRIVEWTGRLWNPDEAEAQTATPVVSATVTPVSISSLEATLPDDLLQKIRDGGVGNGNDTSRSALFHHVIAELKKRRWSGEQIRALLETYPSGVAAKYQGRLADEIGRSYAKVGNTGAATVSQSAQTPGGSPPTGGPAPGAGASGAAGHVLVTIRLQDGQLRHAVEETERAVIAAGVGVFARAGALVYPTGEEAPAANGGKTVMVALREFTTDSFIEPILEAALFERFNMRRKAWAAVDPPIQLVRMVLARQRRWRHPRISGLITTPTLRTDGSLLDAPGYDPATELYLWPGLTLPRIPDKPTKEQAFEALALLKDLFGEFSFKRRALDLAVSLSGLLTALLRGSLPTAPVVLVRAETPGTGKSYLIDVIAMIATGRLCPVITAGRNFEETEKRIGAVLLSGSAIVSLDNLAHDLGGELLCQVTERPVVRIRILGKSEMPDCECHTTVFATGNNIGFEGDMVRRGLLCELETLEERPELREFKRDALMLASADRARYVAAALTIVRAYLTAGAPRVCGPFGSYRAWSFMVRSPLVWLGEPDPCDSIKTIREDDPFLSSVIEFFGLWEIYLRLDYPYATTRIIEIGEEEARAPNNFNKPLLRDFLLKVAATRGKEDRVSPERLVQWLRRISGRPVRKRRLIKGHDPVSNAALFRLTTTS